MIIEKKIRKKKRVALKAAVQKNNRLNRFIHEIEREEPLDNDTLKIVLTFHPIY